MFWAVCKSNWAWFENPGGGKSKLSLEGIITFFLQVQLLDYEGVRYFIFLPTFLGDEENLKCVSQNKAFSFKKFR